MSQINIAVIGAGRIAHSHFAGLLNLPQCYRYAICDPCEDGRAEKLKEQYGVEKACADYKELIGDPKVDAVIVTTPDHSHCEIASAFLRDGKPVLLEKPMALKKEDCEELLKVSKETGTMLMVGQVCRYNHNFVQAKRLIETGTLGDLVFVESEYAHSYEMNPGTDNWRVHPDREAIIGGGCHAIDLLRWIAGNPTEVSAYANHKYLPDWPVNDTTVAIYKFPNDVIGKVFCSIGVKRAYTMRTVIYGTKGTLIFGNYDKTMTFYKANPENIHEGFTKPTIIPCNPKGHNMEAEIRDFVTAIQQGKQPPISPLEGASTVAVARATVESVAKGKPVKIKYPKY